MKVQLELSKNDALKLYSTFKGQWLGAVIIDGLDKDDSSLSLANEIILKCGDVLDRLEIARIDNLLSSLIIQLENNPDSLNNMSEFLNDMLSKLFNKTN